MAIHVKVSPKPNIKVRTRIVVPENLTGVENIDTDNIGDGYVLMYDDERSRYAFVDPDVLLAKAAVTNNSLPASFISKLDEDLDNRIDFDGGNF